MSKLGIDGRISPRRVSVLNFGGDGTENVALIERQCLKALRPETLEEAKQTLAAVHAAMQKTGAPSPT